MTTDKPENATESRDPDELEKFRRMAAEWWDPTGKFKPLHRFNPVRLEYIRDRACEHFGRDKRDTRPLVGLRLLDVGCGGGLLCEPMARLGAEVTGIDAVAENIGIARLHAGESGLHIDYQVATAEDLVAAGETFDIVLSMEVVEHVADPAAFLRDCAGLSGPGGLVFAATLNRTAKAFALAIVGAEYILRWLPRGTHSWRKFLKPSEMVAGLESGGIEMLELTGVVFNPLNGTWSRSRTDMDVNYMGVGCKPA
ncbi:MAG: bifunctional 3-demethylubiquinol 3-O-methyltransferase/2-polyprenyl-6-hydroxyphenol methylase [Alphaproteobacteria bacterium]|nr:bifunctional 3-demethylubiquinol 3-O-methyltransferase/2-polyprenyl-6-hydroxyphenol methylase [Alphaproteobacteria bacterium]|tara:strand:- start:36 stop:797 length:762 start_codon:yes stop_codon:yes gene_type:complete